MKRLLFVFIVFLLVWTNLYSYELKIGEPVKLQIEKGPPSFLPGVDTLYIHTIYRDDWVAVMLHGPGSRLYTGCRLTPRNTGVIDSAHVWIWAARAMNPSPTETLFFWRDTTIATRRQPGNIMSAFSWSFNPTAQGVYRVSLRLTPPVAVQAGRDFWMGILGMQGTVPADSLRACTDTTTSSTPDRNVYQFSARNPGGWNTLQSAGINLDWGVSAFVSFATGVEVVSSNGNYALPKLLLAPNPARGITNISYSLQKEDNVSLSLYDISGKLIRVLKEGREVAGTHSLNWDGKDNNGMGVSSGVYLLRFKTAGRTETRTLIMIR